MEVDDVFALGRVFNFLRLYFGVELCNYIVIMLVAKLHERIIADQIGWIVK